MAARHQTSFLFDLDGTLVDSVYQHVLAWREALDCEGIELSVWRIHRKIGMSGGLFTNMLLRETGLDIDPARIERLRRLHAEAFSTLSCRVRPLPGARELLGYLTRTGIPWAIATSGRMETAGRVLESLGVDLAGIPVITRDVVERAKPDPDLFLAAAGRAESGHHGRMRGRRQHLGYAGRPPGKRARRRAPVRRIRPRRTGAQQRLSGLRGSGGFAAAHRRSRRSSVGWARPPVRPCGGFPGPVAPAHAGQRRGHTAWAKARAKPRKWLSRRRAFSHPTTLPYDREPL
jgi:beta-phosphoglucomutase-like phosphatase (HAD superfamily)